MIRFIHAGIKSTSRINDSLSGSFDISELIVCSSLSVTFSCFNALRAYIRGIKICFNLDYSSGDTVVLCTMPSSVTWTQPNHVNRPLRRLKGRFLILAPNWSPKKMSTISFKVTNKVF